MIRVFNRLVNWRKLNYPCPNQKLFDVDKIPTLDKTGFSEAISMLDRAPAYLTFGPFL